MAVGGREKTKRLGDLGTKRQRGFQPQSGGIFVERGFYSDLASEQETGKYKVSNTGTMETHRDLKIIVYFIFNSIPVLLISTANGLFEFISCVDIG